MDISNKEAVDKLRKYFAQQGIEKISHLCANLIIDLNRFLALDQLTEKEKIDLLKRSNVNMQGVYKFLSEENEYDLQLKEI